jgi:hypothetical protein
VAIQQVFPQTDPSEREEHVPHLSIHHNLHLDFCTCACSACRQARLDCHEVHRKVVFPPAGYRTVRARAFPPRGKSAENRWRLPFAQNRAPPHLRHGFAATKICATRFASSFPQDSPAQLMFELARFSRPGLSRSLRFEFCADPCGARAARRRGCRTSASQDAGFRAHPGPAACHAAQALQVVRFFALSARCADANCFRFAATRLKFAA